MGEQAEKGEMVQKKENLFVSRRTCFVSTGAAVNERGEKGGGGPSGPFGIGRPPLFFRVGSRGRERGGGRKGEREKRRSSLSVCPCRPGIREMGGGEALSGLERREGGREAKWAGK